MYCTILKINYLPECIKANVVAMHIFSVDDVFKTQLNVTKIINNRYVRRNLYNGSGSEIFQTYFFVITIRILT